MSGGGGVSRESGTQRVDVAGVGTTNSALDVNATFQATEVGVTAGEFPLPVSVAGVKVTASAMNVNAVVTGVTAAAVTAAGGVPLPVNIADVSAQVPVTAGDLPIPVTIAAQPIAVSAAGGALGVAVTGNVGISAAAPIPISAAGGVVSAHVFNDVGVSILDQPIAVSAAGGRHVVALRSDYVIDAAVTAVPKFAVIDIAAAACAHVISGSSGKSIRVLDYDVVVAGTVEFRWCTSTDFTPLTGSLNLARGIAPGPSPYGKFQAAVNDAICVQLGGAVSAQGNVTYIEV